MDATDAGRRADGAKMSDGDRGGRADVLHVTGGVPLRGRVRVGGSKNAALPMLAATALLDGPTTLRRVPELTDTRLMIGLLRGLGAAVSGAGGTVRVDPGGVRWGENGRRGVAAGAGRRGRRGDAGGGLPARPAAGPGRAAGRRGGPAGDRRRVRPRPPARSTGTSPGWRRWGRP